MLNLSFSSMYYDSIKFEIYGELSSVRQFEIYSEEKLIGELIHSSSVSFFTFSNYSFRISSTKSFSKEFRFIIDLSSNVKCGLIKNDIFNFSSAKLIIVNNVFQIQNISEQKKLILREENDIDLELCGEGNKIKYSFKISRHGVGNNCDGKIQSNSDDLFLIFSGLYFAELTLDRCFDL